MLAADSKCTKYSTDCWQGPLPVLFNLAITDCMSAMPQASVLRLLLHLQQYHSPTLCTRNSKALLLLLLQLLVYPKMASLVCGYTLLLEVLLLLLLCNRASCCACCLLVMCCLCCIHHAQGVHCSKADARLILLKAPYKYGSCWHAGVLLLALCWQRIVDFWHCRETSGNQA